MGSPSSESGRYRNERQRQVCVEDFSIGKYEVTQEQWDEVMIRSPYHFLGLERPVEQVSWDDAQDYIEGLNQETGKRYRLPTEAEWEYACRSGGKAQLYCGGDSVDDLAWYRSNSDKTTHPVGGKLPNGLGLYDMSGNVYEWTCSGDGPGEEYEGSENRCVESGGNGLRIIRGGSLWDKPRKVRSAYRDSLHLAYWLNHIGFRLAHD